MTEIPIIGEVRDGDEGHSPRDVMLWRLQQWSEKTRQEIARLRASDMLPAGQANAVADSMEAAVRRNDEAIAAELARGG